MPDGYALWNLIQGRKYRLRYMMEDQRRAREMVATYLSVEKAPLSIDGYVYLFSGRPEFGTLALGERNILDRPFEVVDTIKCYFDRKV